MTVLVRVSAGNAISQIGGSLNSASGGNSTTSSIKTLDPAPPFIRIMLHHI